MPLARAWLDRASRVVERRAVRRLRRGTLFPGLWSSGGGRAVLPKIGRSASTALAAVLVVSALLTACGASSGHPPSASPRRTATPSLSGTSPSPGATPSPALTASWPEYHHDAQRTGQSAATPDVSTLSTWWTARLDGAVWAEPLVVGDKVIVVTENDTLYALDPENGAVVWKDNF